MATALEKAGKTTGINFNNERRVHNTTRSHRLVRLADEQGKGDDMIEQLFQGYFEEGRNIADVDVLLDLAQKVIFISLRCCWIGCFNARLPLNLGLWVLKVQSP